MTATAADPLIADPTLAALVADVEAANARLQAYLSGHLAPEDPDPAWPADPDHPDLLTPEVAALRAGADASTLRRWARQHGIGRMYGVRWRISLARLRTHLNG